MTNTQKPPAALPTNDLPMVNEGGLITEGWWGFFSNLTSAATPIVAITAPATMPVGGFKYTAIHAGFLLIRGGTVSSVGLVRRRVSISPVGPVAGFFPMSQNDQLVITYSVAPALWFVANGNPA
jgi:hypothetical protein